MATFTITLSGNINESLSIGDAIYTAGKVNALDAGSTAVIASGTTGTAQTLTASSNQVVVGTTVSGIALTLNSDNDMTATFGLSGNTMVVSHVGAVAAAAATAKVWEVAAVDAYSTVAITRDLTSGASLTATYKSSDDSLTLKAAVTF